MMVKISGFGWSMLIINGFFLGFTLQIKLLFKLWNYFIPLTTVM